MASLSFDPTEPIYKLLTAKEWNEFKENNTFFGSAVDMQDGFIHLSSRSELRTTGQLYFPASLGPLVLFSVSNSAFGPDLKWERSKSRGAYFPHLYRKLVWADVDANWELGRDEQGNLIYPQELNIP